MPEPATSPRALSSPVLIRAAVFLLIAALYFVRLGFGGLWDNSEPTYGEIVKEMLRSGNWLTLHYNFAPWFVHPPLWFWSAGAAVLAFGLNEFALRVPAAIFGLLTVGAIYLAGRRMYGETVGLLAALATGTCLELIVLSRMAILDTMLLFFMTATFFWSFFAVRNDDRRAFWIAVVAAALGTMTKGPLAVVLPVLALLAYCAWSRSWRQVRVLPWLAGLVVYLVLAGVWFAIDTALNGPQFLAAYFGLSTVGRFLAPLENQPGPWWYYIPILILGFFPSIAFLPNAVAMAWRTRGESEKFLLCYAALPLVFFSIAQTKLPNYIAAIFPALGLMVGKLLGDAVEANDVRRLRTALIVLPASLALLVIGVALYARVIFHGPIAPFRPGLELLGWVTVVGASSAFVLPAWLRRAWLTPAALAATMAGFVLVLTFSILPGAESAKPMKGMAAVLMSLQKSGDRVCFSDVKQGFSLLFYTDAGPVVSVGHKIFDVPPEKVFNQRSRALCVASPHAFNEFHAQGFRLHVLSRTPTLWLVADR